MSPGGVGSVGAGARGAGRSSAEVSDETARAIDTEISQLRRLVETEAVEDARALVRELAARWPESERVQHWVRVLEPPKSRVEPGDQAPNRNAAREWLREHAHEHPGCWLAVFDAHLIAADPNLQVVLAATRQAIGPASALIHFQPQMSDAP